MYKAYLSFRFTGEDLNKLEPILQNIIDNLNTPNKSVFCSFWLEDYFKRENFTNEQIYDYCIDIVRKCDTFIPFVKSQHRSQGMQAELKEAKKLNKRIILLIKDGVAAPEFEKSSDKIIKFKDFDDLYSKLNDVLI